MRKVMKDNDTSQIKTIHPILTQVDAYSKTN
jgi:hypothetical protein